MPTHPTALYTLNPRRIYAYTDLSPATLGEFHFPRYEGEDSETQSRVVNMADVPAMDGGLALNGEDTAMEWLAVTRRMTFLADTPVALQESIDNMQLKLSGGRGYLWRYVPHASDPTLRYQWALAQVAQLPLPMVSPDTQLMASCAVKFLVPGGLWYLDFMAQVLYGEAGIYGEGLVYGSQGQGWSIDDVGAPYSVSHVISNRGNAWARSLVIQVIASTNGCQHLTITNSTTGHSIHQDGALTDGQTWEWDTFRPRVRKYTGTWALYWANCTPGAAQRGLFALAPGANTIVVSSTAAIDADIALEYYEPST
jgi:hypothetical protein